MCGIIGVFDKIHSANLAYDGLLTLQHRGQDGAGILSYDFNSHEFNQCKNSGLVASAITKGSLAKLTGQMSIGHTRYSTVGKKSLADLQPMLLHFPFGLGMVHNGNIVNYYDLKTKLREDHRLQFISGNDLEVIQNIFALKLHQIMQSKSCSKVKISLNDLALCTNEVFAQVIGGYSVIGELADHGLFAFRDPLGLRPLVLGKKNNGSAPSSYIFASETVALEYLGFDYVRDVKPGELVFIDSAGKLHQQMVRDDDKKANCMFEWIYFSSPESIIENKLVYQARLKLGQAVGRKVRDSILKGDINPDVIVPVPETSRVAAIQCAEELKLPYREVLIKNRYVQRSFILNTQNQREEAVKLKLSPVRGEFYGKRVLLLDDSIVRGTTSRSIIKMVKNAGAKEIIFASTCAPIKHPCYFGIDFPDSSSLIASGRTINEITTSLGADKVIYLTENEIAEAIGLNSLCMACLNGKYPVNVKTAEQFREKRKIRDEQMTIHSQSL